jgi:hypothetical protein
MKHVTKWIGGAALLLGMPLLGIWLAGGSVAPYLKMPPRTDFVSHSPFSWPVFCGLAIFIIVTMGPFVWRIMTFRPVTVKKRMIGHFPWWGWLATFFGAGVWVLAWSRFAWFAPFQPFTFTPLWLAYIIVMNALAFRRTGRSPLTQSPISFLALFPVSAGFWWFFEYLNRFVQNWHYIGIGPLSAEEYVLRATLPFATVLPAFVATRAWLRSFPGLSAGLANWRPCSVQHPHRLAWAGLTLAAGGLAGISIWPEFLFPLLWISPLIVIASILALQGIPSLLNAPGHGNWQPLFLAALSALVCGFFWEMWNFYSLEKWIYTVPYVDRFRLFEMPLLGFAGYLPFGLECALIAEWVGGSEEQSGSQEKEKRLNIQS